MAAAYSVISTPQQRRPRGLRDKGPYDGSTKLGALSNVGYQQAKFNLATMQAGRAAVTDRLARRGAGARVRLGHRHGRQRRGGERRRPRLHRRRLHASAPTPPRRCGSTSSATCASNVPGVARRRPDLARRGAAAVRPGADVPGRTRSPRPVGGGRQGHERHLPRHQRPAAAVLPPVLTGREPRPQPRRLP